MSYRFSLELQCASLFSPKISSQIKPAKFETFETETYFRRKTVSVAKKQNLLVRNCFRFQKKIHLSFKKSPTLPAPSFVHFEAIGWSSMHYCLVLLQVPKCFVPVQNFWAIPKIWMHLVPLQKLLCRHKNQFYWMQIIFLSGTKYFWLPQHVNEFSVWHKKFGPSPKHFGTCKRARHLSAVAKIPILLNANHLFVWHKMFVTAKICK